MIEIGDLSGPDDDFGGVDTSVRDDGGQLSYSQPTGFYNDVVLVPGALRSTRPDGTITLLSEFGGVAPTFLSEDAKGNIALAGTPPPFPPAPPVAAAAPETSPSTGWFAQFDSHGKLLASTYTDYNGVVGGPIAVGPDSSVYFATANSIVKWVPGSPKFAFTAPVQNVTALAVNSTAVAFALSLSPGQPTTPGVTEATYQGPWDLYIGELNAISGDLQLATYVPITGASQDSKTIITKVAANLALARSGELWIASEINFSNGGKGHTLTAMSADGSRVLDSESIPLFASLAFDHAGNLAFVGFTNVPNLPTTPDAAQRVVCNAFGTTRTYLYLAKRAPDNSVPYATYVPGVSDLGGEKVLSFNGRFVIGEGPVLDSAPTMAGIGCFIDTASRLAVNSQNYFSYNIAATGELLTIVGHGLGPLEEFDAPLDGNGKLPTQLGGVQVLADGIPLPLLSVQQGLVTFYVEPGTVRHSNLGETTLQVQWPSDPVPRREKPRATSESLLTNGTPGFSVFSSDGTGTGQAAALNQDGTVNSSSSPAAPGSIVAIFGNGEGAPSSVTIANLAAEIISFGPAPGLPPGVHQLNVRVPQVAPAGPAPLNVSTTYISIK